MKKNSFSIYDGGLKRQQSRHILWLHRMSIGWESLVEFSERSVHHNTHKCMVVRSTYRERENTSTQFRSSRDGMFYHVLCMFYGATPHLALFVSLSLSLCIFIPFSTHKAKWFVFMYFCDLDRDCTHFVLSRTDEKIAPIHKSWYMQ